MKKMFRNKDGAKGKNAAFYIAAVVCAIAIISTGYIVANNMSPKKGNDTAQFQVQMQTPAPTLAPAATPKPASEPVSGTVKNVPKSTPKPAAVHTASAQETKPVLALASTKLEMPVKGTVSVPHSNDMLVYSETFDDWRAHNGVDIQANLSDQVKAAADGVVEKIYEDNLLGTVIEINHGGFKTLYANLSTDKMVKEGKQVKKGDIISGVGETSISEAGTPHLHFEVLENDKSVDPQKYLEGAQTRQ